MQANRVAIATAVNHTTPFSPRLASNWPTTTSYSHSQANHGLPAIVEENESTRGIACVARICCPVRMCHPIPASPSRRTESGVNTSTVSSATKIKSATDGMAARAHDGASRSEELLEPSAIALNLIEVRLITARTARTTPQTRDEQL